MQAFYRALYYGLCAAGRPFGGVRPRRLYDILGRRAFTQAEFSWQRNRWGAELLLSPYYHIDRNILIFGCYDEDLHLALERLVQPGMICFDVGANLGEMALHIGARARASGTVYAFEPVPEVFARLQKHIERNAAKNVRAFQIALSDSSGRGTIAAADASADNQGLASIVNLEHVAAAKRIEIETQTLDEFVKAQQIARIDLMKIDIQGAEPRLLEGGRGVFSSAQAPDLLMEISPEDLSAAGKNSRELCEMLEGFGYSIFELRKGERGRRISAAEVRPDFRATNVYCSKR